ncbi:hypothetical protein R3P38DRAFT_2768118 [Favolaschia claudopus]
MTRRIIVRRAGFSDHQGRRLFSASSILAKKLGANELQQYTSIPEHRCPSTDDYYIDLLPASGLGCKHRSHDVSTSDERRLCVKQVRRRVPNIDYTYIDVRRAAFSRIGLQTFEIRFFGVGRAPVLPNSR